MQVVTNIAELRAIVADWRSRRERVAFVPTMGNLHAGHMALVQSAVRHADRRVASIFVNPSQFGPCEDFSSYPRTFAADCAQLAEHGIDLVFAPPVAEMYPDGLGEHTEVTVPSLDGILCGAFRPGHFTGVATVVTKLLNIVGPDMALFGEKDYQQLLVIKRLVKDLALPITIRSVPTVRERDGLAMSSRNGYLSEMERRLAPQIYASLQTAAQALAEGNSDFHEIEQVGQASLTGAGFAMDYFVVRQASNLAMPEVTSADWVVLTAARLGNTRLIDNIAVHNPR